MIPKDEAGTGHKADSTKAKYQTPSGLYVISPCFAQSECWSTELQAISEHSADSFTGSLAKQLHLGVGGCRAPALPQPGPPALGVGAVQKSEENLWCGCETSTDEVG